MYTSLTMKKRRVTEMGVHGAFFIKRTSLRLSVVIVKLKN